MPAAAVAINTTLLWVVQPGVLLLSLNIMGQSSLPLPIPATQHDLEHSELLMEMHLAAETHMKAVLARTLLPSADDPKHLNDWLEAADYATKALVMMAGVIGLDGGAIPPPEGECRTVADLFNHFLQHLGLKCTGRCAATGILALSTNCLPAVNVNVGSWIVRSRT
jgi:hypothetical protein